MIKRLILAGAMALVAGASAHAAEAVKCKIGLLGEMKVRLEDSRLVLPGAIDGQPVRALADTGAGMTLISAAAAGRLRLPLDDVPGAHAIGVGGNVRLWMGRMKSLTLGSYTAHDMRLLVGGEGAQDFDILIGQDFWGARDLEVDVAGGVMRLLQPDRACRDDDFVYWAKPGQAYGFAPMLEGESGRRREIVTVKLNGMPVRALLDTGAARSVATLRVADRLHLDERRQDGVARGLGPRRLQSYVAQLDSFSIGDETIKNTLLRFSDLYAGGGFIETGSHIMQGTTEQPDMLLGADFLRAHHVLISQARRKVYFTYEGGPVFDVRTSPSEGAAQGANPPGG